MISNAEIAALLEEFADLLEIQGANPFRIRAYRNAARTVESLTQTVASLVEEDADLTELPAIGNDMSDHLESIVESGSFEPLEELTEVIPRSLGQLVKLDGVGPKKAKKLFEELGIETVDQLEEATEAGRVEALEGFGKKSAEKILRSIQALRAHQSRFLIVEADDVVGPLLEHMAGAPELRRVEVAGSYRRRRETVGDIDLLAQIDDDSNAGQDVVDHFAAYPDARRVDAAGRTKGSITLRSGLQVDLRVIPERSWGSALHYFTGSKEHNVRLRQMAQREGLRVNEWGVFRVPDREKDDGSRAASSADDSAEDEAVARTEGIDPSWQRLAGATEEDVYRTFGLPYIEPELRENRGEIEAGFEERLPDLVRIEDLRGDLQMHSTWSDGKTSIEEMARACVERGYEYMAITDHSPNLAMVQGLTPEKAREQWEEIEEVQERVPEIHVFRSCEVDILRDGSLDMPDEILDELDLVLVSVHSLMEMSETEMTDRIVRALSHPSVDVLAHPTGRILNRRNAYALDLEAVLEAAKEYAVAVELNADPHRLDLNDVQVRRAKELGIPVVISTDAHAPSGLDAMRYGVAQARRGWLEAQDVLNCRSLSKLSTWLERKRS